MSGGAHNMEYAVDVRAVPPPQAPALDKLYEAQVLKEVEVPLDGADRAAQGVGQGLHLGPAQAGLVVGVVGDGAVGGDRLCRDSGLYEVAHLGYARELRLWWHAASCSWCGGALWRSVMIRFTKAAGSG